MEPWLGLLRDGQADAAWEAFLARYHRLILASIRHYVADHDDVMDAFARVCESLRDHDLARLRKFVEPTDGTRSARFTTWLVAVVRNLTVDWLRHRDGRPRRQPPTHLTPRQRRIWQLVHVEGRSHRDAFHLLSAEDGGTTSHAFATDLAAAVAGAPAQPPVRPAALRTAGMLPATLAAAEPGEEVPADDALGSALDALPADDRLALQLYIIDELPAADVARIVGWPGPKTVYNRVTRTLKSLRLSLGGAAERPSGRAAE